jgi:hypothetical protein
MAGGGLDREQVARYRRDGFLFPIPVLAPAEITALCAWLDAFEAEHADLPKKQRRETKLRFKPHLLHPILDRVVRNARILDAVESCIGPDILVWSSAFFIKDGSDTDRGDPSFISWHQDSVTYGLAGDELVSAWIAFSDADPENASMRFLPGSHRGGLVKHRFAADPANMSSLGETIDGIDESAAVDLTLKAGEMSLHNIHLIHASGVNRTTRRRIGYVVRYIPPTTRSLNGAASALLARGQDRFGNFAPERSPVAADDPATIAHHRWAQELRGRRVELAAAGQGEG